MENVRSAAVVCVALALCVCVSVEGTPDWAAGGVAPETCVVAPSPALDYVTGGMSSALGLEHVGREISAPPESRAFLNGNTHDASQLPAVPAAVFMGIWGFLCLSLVRDRRAWIGMFAGVLCAGQHVFEVVPELGHRLSKRFVHVSCSPAGSSIEPEILSSSDTLTGNAQQRQFAGLLRKLEGIPHSLSSVISDGVGMCMVTPAKVIAGGVFARDGNGLHESDVLCSVCATGHFVVFSPAFEFCNLGRGPPAV